MDSGIIFGWFILFALFCVCKKNKIFQLNTSPQDSLAECYEDGE